MVCFGFLPGAAGWRAQTNPLSYGGIFELTLSLKRLAYRVIRNIKILIIGYISKSSDSLTASGEFDNAQTLLLCLPTLQITIMDSYGPVL